MQNYTIFGGCLRSELVFPELHPGDGRAPSWHLRVERGAYAAGPEELLGTGTEPHCRVTLHRCENGFHLHHSCTGDFELSADGSRITWYPREGAQEEMARADVMGRVLSTALHAGGKIALHGSGVVMGDEAVAFLAPKGYGKSTLALALVNAGARLVTDDTFAVDPADPVRVLPGVHRMRLCTDAAARLIANERATELGIDGKHVVDERGDERRVLEAVPLAAIYLLAPASPESVGDQAVQRTRLPAPLAAMSILRHAKIGALLGGSEAPRVIERAAALVRVVPVYELAVVRDLECIDAVVGQLMDWHGAGCVGGVR